MTRTSSRRKTFTKVRCNDIIVRRSMATFQMNDNTRKKEEKIHKDNEKVNIAHDDGESYAMLLMATTCEGNQVSEQWYLDSGCYNNMKGPKK